MKTMKHSTLIISICILINIGGFNFSYAQNADSLINHLSSDFTESNFNLLFRITEHYYRDNPDSAFYFANKASKIADFLNNDELKARALENTALCYLFNNQSDIAIRLFKQEFDIWAELGNNDKMARATIDVGLIYSQSGILDSALLFYNNALDLYRKSNNTSEKIHTINKIAITQRRFGNFKLALEYYFTALEMAETNGLEKQEASTCNDIGIVYKLLSKPGLALEYFNRSVKIYENFNDTNRLGVLYNNVGSIYYINEKNDSARIFFQKALEINMALKNWIYVADILLNISRIYNSKGDKSNAIDYARQALEINFKHGFKLNLISSYYTLGLNFQENEEIDSAKKYFNKSLDLAIQLQIKRKVPRAYFSLHKIAIATNDYKIALEYYKLYKAYNDSLITEKTKKEIAEMHTKYETEKTKKENESLKLQKEKDKNANIKLFILSVLLLFILLLVFYFFIMKSRTSKRNQLFYEKEKQLNEAQQKTSETEKKRFEELIFAEKKINELQKEKILAKNKELTTLVMSIHNKNKILENLSNEIESIEQANDYSLQALQKLKGLVSGKQIVEEDWHVFKKQIEEVYPGFFDRLKKKCPSFTVNDHRLCSYLLIEMNTKEIAGLLNVTDAAVIKSRQRLRKKVNIGTNEDFLDFLRKI